MKAFTNVNARDIAHARRRRVDRRGRRSSSVALAGGGSDLLGMMKDRLVTPDVVVNLKSIEGLDHVKPRPAAA